MNAYASSRIPFGLFRGGRTKPGQEPDSFAKLWAERTRENFLKACDEHLDAIICEYDQMFLDAVSYRLKEDQVDVYDEGAKDAFREALLQRFPFQPVERTTFATLDELQPAWDQLHIAPNWGRTALTGWRNMDTDDFERVALEHMQGLFAGHERLRGGFCSVVNRIDDKLGWGFFDIRYWHSEFGALLRQLDYIDQPND